MASIAQYQKKKNPDLLTEKVSCPEETFGISYQTLSSPTRQMIDDHEYSSTVAKE
jgi:hypothetical protein